MLTFLVPGQGKSGTSTIYLALKEHPEVFVPETKENAFFANELYHYGFPYYEYYFQKGYRGEIAVGDCYSANLFNPLAPRRLFETFGPDLKLLFLMRQPLDRAVSHYNMAVRQLRETLPLKKAILEEADRYTKHPALQMGFSYLGRGRYLSQIKAFHKYFPMKNMKFFVFEEDIKDGLENTIIDICNFIGVDPEKRPTDLKPQNIAPNNLGIEIKATAVSFLGKKILASSFLGEKIFNPSSDLVYRIQNVPNLLCDKLEPEFEENLYKVWFADEVKELETLIGRDLSIWYRSYEMD